MSSDIDIREYAGENDQAAVDPSQGFNSYQDQPETYLPPLESVPGPAVEQAAQPAPQAENFRLLREEVDRLKNERESEKREYQNQLDMLKANVAQRYEPAPQAKEHRMFEGMQDNDVPNVAELRREWEVRESGYKARMEELEVQTAHSDYIDVIQNHTLPLIKQKPHLAREIQNATNKALLAYEFGKMAQQASQVQAPAQPRQSETAQRIVENARKPTTLAQAGGQSVLSKADYYASMSDQEFMRLANRHLESI